MDRTVVSVGPCAGVKEILSLRGYAVEYAEQKNVLDVLKKDGIEAIFVDMDDVPRANVVISGIRHLYPAIMIIAVSGNKENRNLSGVLKAGASNYIIKPVTEKSVKESMEEVKAPLPDESGSESKASPSALDESKKLFPSRFYNAFFVTEYGKLEALRAERYNKSFSLVMTHIEGFNNLKQKLEKNELLDFLKDFIRVMMEALRNCDVLGMVEDKRLVAVLPETDYFGSCITIRKLKKSVERFTTKGEPYASVIFSSATFPRDGNGYGELLRITEGRVNDQRHGLWHRLRFEEKPFWEIVSALMALREQDEADTSVFELGKGLDLPAFFLDRLQEVILQEIVRDPKKKGVLYLGIRKITPTLPILKAIETIGLTKTKIFIIGEGEEKKWNLLNATPIYLSDPRLLETFFVFFLREDFAYAAVCREKWGEQFACFHTVDQYLIEGLIAKLQSDYLIQEHF